MNLAQLQQLVNQSESTKRRNRDSAEDVVRDSIIDGVTHEAEGGQGPQGDRAGLPRAPQVGPQESRGGKPPARKPEALPAPDSEFVTRMGERM